MTLGEKLEIEITEKNKEILNQLIDDVEKHGVDLVKSHIDYYIKQLNELCKTQS
jgi:hypothetical protein